MFGDRDGLHRVVVNLVDNAVRYAQTEVEVGVSRDEAGGTAVARLTVTDDGPGLPEAERDRVFDRFYRAETSRSRDLGGTGLGLPIVRDLVRAHNGAVELVARPDGCVRPAGRRHPPAAADPYRIDYCVQGGSVFVSVGVGVMLGVMLGSRLPEGVPDGGRRCVVGVGVGVLFGSHVGGGFT